MTLLTLCVAAGVWVVCLRSPAVWRATGIGETSIPFIDLYGLLAAGELAEMHGDPFRPNPLDPYHRPHVYTEWWLATGAAGLTRTDTLWLGWAQVGLSLVAAVALVRPRRPWPAIQMLLVLCSPALLMAVNRGNNDLAVFVLVCAALASLRADSPGVRMLAVVLLAVAAVLKYYPLAALVVLLGSRSRREFSAALLLYAVVLLLAWPALKPGLASAAQFKPHPEGLYAFGAPTLFRDFGVESPAGWLALSAFAGMAGIWLARAAGTVTPLATVEPSAEREFACGAVLLVGCFFLGASFLYKMIFAVLLLPWFASAALSPADARWRRAGWWLLLAVLWFEGTMAVVINLGLAPWSPGAAQTTLTATLVAGQILTWGLMIFLMGQLLRYCLARIRHLFPRHPPLPLG